MRMKFKQVIIIAINTIKRSRIGETVGFVNYFIRECVIRTKIMHEVGRGEMVELKRNVTEMEREPILG